MSAALVLEVDSVTKEAERTVDRLTVLDNAACTTTSARCRSPGAIATPGHTPGHQSVLLDTGDEVVLVAGDLLVHAVQLIDPDVSYANEVDPDQARVTRRVLLDQLAARGGLLATAHLSEAFLVVCLRNGLPVAGRG